MSTLHVLTQWADGSDRSRAGWLRSPGNAALAWLALGAIGLAAFFWSGLSSLVTAWSRPEYSHGYVIPLVAIYLFLSGLHAGEGERGAGEPRGGLGVGLVLAGLALGFLGNLVHIPDINTYGLLLCLAGFMFTGMGARRGLWFLVPIAYLGFMLPLPNFVYWPLSIRLMTISSELGVYFIGLLGIPVYLDGNIIDLGTYKLQVAEACNGLRYLFPLMSFGFLFAVLYKGPVWHKALLFLSTMPITVLMNCVRIAMIGFLVDRYGTEQAEGFLHFFEGWIIFMACIAVLYGLAAALQRLTTTPRPVHRMLETDFHALLMQFGRARDIAPTPALIFVCALTFALGLTWHLMPQRAAASVARDPLVLFPQEFEGWRGTPEILSREVERVLAANDHLLTNYQQDGSAAAVNFFVAYYPSHTDGSGIHSPEACLPGGGWEVSRWTTAETGLRTASGYPLRVNRAIIQKGTDRQLVYYWFAQRGRPYTSAYAAKASTIWDSLTLGRTEGALVRVVTPLSAQEPVEAADDRLRRFLRSALERLPRHVPE